MNVQIAQRLAELRRQKGYSQESLAHELGLSRQAVSKWERAESSPDTDNLIALARLYGVSLDELLCVNGDVEDDVAAVRDGRAAGDGLAASAAADERERVLQATAAATEASKAAAQAAEAAAHASRRVQEASASAVAEGSSRRRAGAWRSFPYGTCMVLLFFVLVFAGNAATAWLVFLTVPLYRWLAGILDDAADRGDHAEGDE